MKKSYFLLPIFLFFVFKTKAQILPGPQFLKDTNTYFNKIPISIFNDPAVFFQQSIQSKRRSAKEKEIIVSKRMKEKKESIGQQSQYGCSDTSARLVYKKDSTWIGGQYITKTRDGTILIPGNEYNFSNFKINAILIKCTQSGDTIWSKAIRGGYDKRQFYLYRAFELSDESILLVGNMSLPMPYQNREDFMMIRVTSNGNLIWEKTYRTRLWDIDTLNGTIQILDCKQDFQGNLYMCGEVSHQDSSRQALAFKMNLDGNVLWSKGVATGAVPSFNGINLMDKKVVFIGNQ